ncbi:xanthine dehydrogenase family protein molybdopterin-binding subunit [Membranihabitans maritimus]|uniref:xanthine dehydrogenase family protein molybdopterin-binding subunit n=1 Tax=Membranihabitans maritimus TaxID=2904244 RepID=UPI001F3B81B2|nr:molybdopterin cofactor-binding domain-containing protein [Membranihabitans maritimus]
MRLNRRSFIKNTGYVAVGFTLFPNVHWILDTDCETNHSPIIDAPAIRDWIQILEDGNIRVITGKMELGQGIRIAIAQVAAEELNTPIERIEVFLADTEITPNEGYTAGSQSIVRSAMAVRQAAAAAAEVLLGKASAELGIDKNELNIQNGYIIAKKDGGRFTFREILKGAQLEENTDKSTKLKPKNQYRYVGHPVPRKDIEKMVRGKSVYVQDLRFPGMLHARIARSSSYRSKLIEYNPDNAEKINDVVKIIRTNDFIGVLAHEEYQAIKAKRQLEQDCIWSKNGFTVEFDNLKDHIKDIAEPPVQVQNKGSLHLTNKTHKAEYYKPYIMHGANGPSCAVAICKNGKVHIWSHTQGVFPLRGAIAQLLDFSEEDVRITGVPGAGCYGHNAADDAAAEAAILAVEYPNHYIRLQWDRTEEHGLEPYGCAMIMDLEASLSADGKIDSWQCNVWSDSHSTRPSGNEMNLLPTGSYKTISVNIPQGYRGGGYRNADPYYSIPNLSIDAHFYNGPLRVSSLRSLGAFANIFAIECFMDELAELAGIDPVQFRIQHIDDNRAREVLEKVVMMTSGITPNQNQGLGFGFSRYKNSASYCAVAALISIERDKTIKVQKMWAAIDSGEVINPDGLTNQTEGGMIQSASWTLLEEVKFHRNNITSRDWYSYPILRFPDTPEVEVEIINRPYEPPMGAGEAAQGPSSAAIANAVYQASGKRIRNLPLNRYFNL